MEAARTLMRGAMEHLRERPNLSRLIYLEIISEGGYETRGLIPEAGFFSAEAEKAAVAKVREMAQKAGRKMPSSQ